MEHGAHECRAAVKDGSYCTRTNAYTAVHRCMYTYTHKCHLRVCILRKTIHIYACVRVYICLCACVHCIERKPICEEKKKDSHCGRGKQNSKKQNFINACFTCLRLNVTLLYIGVHIHIRTHAHTCGD